MKNKFENLPDASVDQKIGLEEKGDIQNKELSDKEDQNTNNFEGKINPEDIEKAEEFDKELSEGLTEALKTDSLSPEQASLILNSEKKLSPEDKTRLMKEMEDAGKTPKEEEATQDKSEKSEKEEAPEDSQESFGQYEKAIDNLAERANAVGVKVSSKELKNILEMFRKISGDEKEGKIEWKEYFDDQTKELLGIIQKIEKIEEGEKEKKGNKTVSGKEKDATYGFV